MIDLTHAVERLLLAQPRNSLVLDVDAALKKAITEAPKMERRA